MLQPRPRLRENISRTLWGWLMRLENPAGDDAVTNGEYAFLKRWAAFEKARGQSLLVAFDIGVNKGDHSAEMLKVAENAGAEIAVHAFEPTSSALAHLEKRFAGQGKLTLNPVAVSDEAGEQTIYFDSPLSGFASLHQREDVQLGNSETIRTLRLDDYVAEKGIAHVHLIKMDIEGHELAALRGLGDKLSPDFIDFLQFEYGGANLDAAVPLRDLFGLLTGRGFAMARVLPGGLSPRRYKPWLETYQHGNFIAYNPALNLPTA